MKKYALSLLTLTMALSSGAVFAAGVGDIKTADVDITFASPSSISHDINSIPSLVAGDMSTSTIIAKGTIRFGEATSDKVRVEFVNGTNISGTTRQITTTNGNTLNVKLSPGVGVPFSSVNNTGIIFGNTTESDTFSYDIIAFSGQNVKADTYKIEVSAQRWEA